jgi:hypothetical protein
MILEHIFIGYWAVGVLLNLGALSVEAFTRGHYKNRKTLLRLSFYAIIEPLFYHWINSYLYVVGNLKMLFLGKVEWGKMERVGIKKMPTLQEGILQPVGFTSRYPSYRFVSAIGMALVLLSTATWYYWPEPSTTMANDLASIQPHEITTTPPVESLIKAAESTAMIATSLTDSVVYSRSSAFGPGRIDTLIDQTGNYYIVFASIINPEFVLTNFKTFSSQGLNLKIIPSSQDHRFNRLIIDELPTLEEAQARLHSLEPTYGSQLWVLKW